MITSTIRSARRIERLAAIPFVIAILAALSLRISLAPSAAAGAKDEPKKPKITVGAETTYVTGPLDEEGYVDYVAALNQRMSKGVKTERNGAVPLWRAFGPKPEGAPIPVPFWKWLGIDAPPAKGDYYVPIFDYFKKHAAIDPGKEFNGVLADLDAATACLWRPREYPVVAGWIMVNSKPLDLIVEATQRPQYFSPLVPIGADRRLAFCILSGVNRCRESAQALTSRALLRAGEGRLDSAWQDLLAVHRLGRQIARGGCALEGLAGRLIDGVAAKGDLVFLEQAKLDAKTLRRCLRDLEALPPMPAMAEKIGLCERFVFLDLVASIARDGASAAEAVLLRGAPIPVEARADQLLKGMKWDIVLKRGNRWFDRVAATFAKDPPARVKEMEAIDTDLKAVGARIIPETAGKLLKDTLERRAEFAADVGVALFLSSLTRLIQASDRAEQVQRNGRIAFALAIYKSDHGAYPKTLGALVPKYLATVPGDFFTGKDLVYRPSETGYLFYSLGPNGKDDGGRWFDDDPPGDDPGVRMPRKKR
ncbi:MAG: hypothetical protein U0793_00260 [Gemmataceae bacterium]